MAPRCPLLPHLPRSLPPTPSLAEPLFAVVPTLAAAYLQEALDLAVRPPKHEVKGMQERFAQLRQGALCGHTDTSTVPIFLLHGGAELMACASSVHGLCVCVFKQRMNTFGTIAPPHPCSLPVQEPGVLGGDQAVSVRQFVEAVQPWFPPLYCPPSLFPFAQDSCCCTLPCNSTHQGAFYGACVSCPVGAVLGVKGNNPSGLKPGFPDRSPFFFPHALSMS